MNLQNMRSFFHPESIVVIGASGNPRSLGFMVMRNLMSAGFAGPIMPVNPKYESVSGVLTYRTVNDLPRSAELAIICTPPARIPGLITALGKRGTKAAVVLTAGLETVPEAGGPSIQSLMLERARESGLRIIGPNCLGLIVPGSGINASFAHTGSLTGSLAFVSQSGGLSTGVLDWAKSSGIGFSCFLSLGNSADVGFSDTLAYLTDDAATSAILLYIESIQDAPAFMKAATEAAKRKPVIASESDGPRPPERVDKPRIREIIRAAREAGRTMLSEPEAKKVLAAAGLPVTKTRIARTPEDCVTKAHEIGFPVVLKIISPQISHKSDVGGVALNLENDREILTAARSMVARLKTIRPDAEFSGFSVQQMVQMPSSHELIIGATRDAILGPVVMFGHGGTAVEVIGDHAVALPPITLAIARDMVSQTRVSRLLAGYRDRPKARLDAINQALIQVSELVLAFPEFVELDVNPLLANDERVTAIDARICLAPEEPTAVAAPEEPAVLQPAGLG